MTSVPMSAAEEPTVDIVLVAWNGADVLGPALKSIAASRGVRVRALVVDNASQDRSCDVAVAHGSRVLPMKRNLGYGAALNKGLKATDGTWVALANQDIEVRPDTIQRLIDAVLEHERQFGVPCVVGPRQLTTCGALAETCHNLPSFLGQARSFLAGERAGGSRNVHSSTTERQQCGWVSAALLLARRSTFTAAGGFNTAYFMYVEDVEFFTRIKRLGYHCIWVPDAVIIHHGGRGPRSPKVYAYALWNWRNYWTDQRGKVAGDIILVLGVLTSIARGLLWWLHSLTGDKRSRQYAHMFVGAGITATRWALGARTSPEREPL